MNTSDPSVEIDFNPQSEREQLSPAELKALEAKVFEDIRYEAERRLKINKTQKVEAFYAVMVLRSELKVGYLAPTACIRLSSRGQAIITVNPFYWQKLRDDEMRFDVLVHEILHKLLNHFARFRFNVDPMERHMLNIAMDTALNQLMTNRSKEGHHNGVMKVLNYHTFKELIKPGVEVLERQPAEYYYKMLKENLDPNKVKYVTYGPGDGTGAENHEQSQTDDDGDAVRAELFKEDIRRAMHQAGVTGSDLGLDMTEQHKIKWKQILKMFIQRHVKSFIRKTKNRPNKRFGYAAAKRVLNKVTAIDVVVDTSGSMCGVLPNLFGEILSLCNETVDFHLYTIDTALKYIGKIKTKADLKGKEFPQGGGTCFETALPELNRRKERRPVIFMTDTYGEFPETPPNYEIIMLTTEPKLYERVPEWARRKALDVSELLEAA